jgi:hypothetical protein
MDVFEELTHNMFVLKGSWLFLVEDKAWKARTSGFERISLQMKKFWMVNPKEDCRNAWPKNGTVTKYFIKTMKFWEVVAKITELVGMESMNKWLAWKWTSGLR